MSDGLSLLQAAIRAPDSVGQILQISPPENDPVRIFGLPRKLHFEVRSLLFTCGQDVYLWLITVPYPHKTLHRRSAGHERYCQSLTKGQEAVESREPHGI